MKPSFAIRADKKRELLELRQRRHDKARELKKTMQCNCDLDNWEPEQSTGHSWICRIHKKVMNEVQS